MTDFFDFDPDSDDIIGREVIEHSLAATDRSVARRMALQILYEIDSVGHSVGRVLSHHLKAEDNRVIRRYVQIIIEGVTADLERIDAVLQECADEWPIDQVAIVDRNILRIALFEIAIDKTVPVGAAIDEAMELANLYGAEGTPRFVNGVLGTLVSDLDDVRSQFHPGEEEAT